MLLFLLLLLLLLSLLLLMIMPLLLSLTPCLALHCDRLLSPRLLLLLLSSLSLLSLITACCNHAAALEPRQLGRAKGSSNFVLGEPGKSQ